MGNTWRQPETRIDKKGDKGRQDFGKADTPSNTGTHVGTMGDNSETRRREGRHTIQHRCTCWETMGENGEQWGMGDQGRQDLEKAGTPLKQGNDGRRQGETRPCNTPSNTNAYCGERIGDKRRQDLGKADAPSNTGTCGETVGDNGRQGRGQRRQTYHHRHTCGETMGDKKGRQHVGKADPPSNTGKCVGRQCETMRSMGQKG